VPYRRSVQISRREEVGVSLVALGILNRKQHVIEFDQPQPRAIGQIQLPPVYLWAPSRSKIVDPTSQDFSWGSGK
jgi:hypothetical protein